MEKKIIINIGRQFGGGGLAVASEIGKKLGIPVYDRELIKKAAQDSGFSAELFEQTKSVGYFHFPQSLPAYTHLLPITI